MSSKATVSPSIKADFAGLTGVVTPIILQVLTGKVSWPVAAGLAVAAAIVYTAGVFHITGKSLDAIASRIGGDLTGALSALHGAPPSNVRVTSTVKPSVPTSPATIGPTASGTGNGS